MIGLGWEKLYVLYIGRGQYTNIKVAHPVPENNSSDINTVHLTDSLQATRNF